MLQNTSNRICANHGKKMLFGKKGKVNGVKSIVYEKDGVVIAYKPIEDLSLIHILLISILTGEQNVIEHGWKGR